MSGQNDGIIIDGDERGNATANADTRGGSDTKGRISEPEIIGGYTVSEPDTERIDTGTEPVKRGRGRPKGSGNGTRNTNRTSDSTQADQKLSGSLTSLKIDELLLSIHLMGATFFQTPELALTAKESADLSNAIQKVGEFHALTFDPKKVAYFQLAVCAGGVYLPRAAKVWNRWKKERNGGSAPIAVERDVRPINQTRPQQPPARPLSEVTPSEIFGSESAAI